MNWIPERWRPVESDKHFLQGVCFLRKRVPEIMAPHLTVLRSKLSSWVDSSICGSHAGSCSQLKRWFQVCSLLKLLHGELSAFCLYYLMHRVLMISLIPEPPPVTRYVQYSEPLESPRKWVISYSGTLWSNPATRDESSAGWLLEGHAFSTNRHRPDEACSPVKALLSQSSWSAIYSAWNVNKVLHRRTLSARKDEVIAAMTFLACATWGCNDCECGRYCLMEFGQVSSVHLHKIQTAGSTKMSVIFYQTTRCHILEDSILYLDRALRFK
jgi:hypothetical protein